MDIQVVGQIEWNYRNDSQQAGMNAYHEGDDDVEPYLVGKTLGGEDC